MYIIKKQGTNWWGWHCILKVKTATSSTVGQPKDKNETDFKEDLWINIGKLWSQLYAKKGITRMQQADATLDGYVLPKHVTHVLRIV
jgi:hypothetical protein